MNKAVFFSSKRGLKNWVEMWSNFCVEYLTATPYVPFENWHIMYLYQLKIKSQISRKFMIFFSPLKPVLRFLYHNGNTASHFSLFLKLCLASVSQWISLFVITWISTALYPPPYPVVSAQTVLMAHTEVQVMLSDGCMPRAWWNKAGPSRNYAGPHVAHRLYMSATTLTITGHFKRQIKCFKPVRDIQVL